ncbi:MepB protein, partial [Staphylococcus chromogenes]
DWNEEYEGMNLSCKIFSFKIRLAKKTPKKHNS